MKFSLFLIGHGFSVPVYILGRKRMDFYITFFFNSILLGIGLAMDAFSVSLANGLNEPCMKKRKMAFIAGIFSFFQFAMPFIGFLCVKTVVNHFKIVEKFIPYVALAILSFIGCKMIYEAINTKCECCNCEKIGFGALIIQGIGTSIDALSAGFEFEKYDDWRVAAVASLIIGIVTFFICLGGLFIGRTAGTKLSGKAGILGGSILIFIGVEIFITSFLWFFLVFMLNF